jgi:hypothetical protein
MSLSYPVLWGTFNGLKVGPQRSHRKMAVQTFRLPMLNLEYRPGITMILAKADFEFPYCNFMACDHQLGF